ncbi:MAG: DUF1772 domain-containing protein [Cellulomonas sp.]|nr:DUF1772 domain-containing protein [Cellulomonas sp.]
MNALMGSIAAATAVGSGLLGGAFFALSAFVMPGLRQLPAPEAAAAMQAINEAAPRSLLMVPLLMSPAGSVAVAAWAFTGDARPARTWLLVGAAAGLACFAVTAAFHVPRNNALAALDPTAPATVELWTTYVHEWARMNHIRSLLGAAAAASLSAGLTRLSGG